MRIAAILFLCAVLPAAENGNLKIKVDPGRAGVFVDGKYVGPARHLGLERLYRIEAGEHEIRLEEPRYQTFVRKISMPAGATLELHEHLEALPRPEPPFGAIRVQHPDRFAAVYLNGRYMGHAGEFSGWMKGLEVSPGGYEVKVVPLEKGPTLSRTVVVEASRTVVVR